MRIGILGAGLVGKHIALDLHSDDKFSIAIIDKDENALSSVNKDNLRRIEKYAGDLSNERTLKDFLKEMDIVVNAVPGSIGFKVLKGILEEGKDVVDIAFYGRDPFELNELAVKNGVVCLVDMGIAPGMSNVFTGIAYREFDELNDVSIYVGGLPFERKLPFEYRAVFSPTDVIEEYTRPARVVENGKIVEKSPLTEPEYLEFEGIGTLEAFNSDGLRTLADTINVRNMREKTLRYPGHREKMKLFLDTGLFDTGKIEVKGQSISPRDVISGLLFKHWEFTDSDRDFTVMRIIFEGIKNAKRIRRTIDLFDKFDEQNKVHSMARTTGYTAAMGVRLISEGLYTVKGISPPEYLGRDSKVVDFLLKGLKERNIRFRIKDQESD